MGYNHRYEVLKDTDEARDEKQIGNVGEEPRYTSTAPVGTAWWKLLLCNLFAACVGAGVMFVIARGFFDPHPSSDRAASVIAPTDIVADAHILTSATSIISSSTISSSTTPTASTNPTSTIEEPEHGVQSPTDMVGVILDCGHSPEEARAKGCVYDVMMQDWVPEPCYDEVLTEQYLAEGKWTWYADGDGNTTISDEVMRKGEHGAAWMSSSYHKAHCVFSWLKIIRALRNGRGISQELLSYDHVLHCSHGALKAASDDESLGVKAPTNYAKCAIYETWKTDFIPDKHDSSSR